MCSRAYPPDEVKEMPNVPGIYGIVNTKDNHRYVGQALNLRKRSQEHVRDLDARREFTNRDGLLQRAWIEYGRDAFVFRVLEKITDNRRDTHYHIRPDNLNLAEHFYISQNKVGDYNKDLRIVADRHKHLIESQAWREQIDEATIALIRAAKPKPFLVGQRSEYAHAVIVLGFDVDDVKSTAAALDQDIMKLDRNLSTKPLSEAEIRYWLQQGARDLRIASGITLRQSAES
jgi:GIY-YIG catalytic domain